MTMIAAEFEKMVGGGGFVKDLNGSPWGQSVKAGESGRAEVPAGGGQSLQERAQLVEKGAAPKRTKTYENLKAEGSEGKDSENEKKGHLEGGSIRISPNSKKN